LIFSPARYPPGAEIAKPGRPKVAWFFYGQDHELNVKQYLKSDFYHKLK